MGQLITVHAKPGVRPEVMCFELNRSLTGMGIERYLTRDDANGDRFPDRLAAQLFDLGATSVTVYSNMLTVIAPPERWAELRPQAQTMIEHFFIHYSDSGSEPSKI